MSSVSVMSANRTNVPAVCRIPGRGSAILVSCGVLLTTRAVVGTKHEAAKLTAVFFEGTKKAVVEVKLLPDQLYFASMYPEYLDHCLVACETKGIFNVCPVKLPLVKHEWAPVRDGDWVLVIQHPVYESGSSGGNSNPPPSTNGDGQAEATDLKRFEEVMRRRDDLYYLKANGTYRCAGSPVFNDQAELVGVNSQERLEGEGIASRFVSIVTIVKHLFANAQLSKIDQHPLFQDVWDTWYVKDDTTRIVSMMANFRDRNVQERAAERLCEHTSKRELLEGVVACGGTRVIISSIQQFKDKESLVAQGLRSLWNISFGPDDNRSQIVEAEGVHVVLRSMTAFPENEEIAQFGVVLLYNLTLSQEIISTEWSGTALKAALKAMTAFPAIDVIQKFAVGLYVNLIKFNASHGSELISLGAIEHISNVAKERQSNIYLVENITLFCATISEKNFADPALKVLLNPVIELMSKYKDHPTILLNGNNTLWNLGINPINRVAILQNERGVEVLKLSAEVLTNSLSGARISL